MVGWADEVGKSPADAVSSAPPDWIIVDAIVVVFADGGAYRFVPLGAEAGKLLVGIPVDVESVRAVTACV